MQNVEMMEASQRTTGNSSLVGLFNFIVKQKKSAPLVEVCKIQEPVINGGCFLQIFCFQGNNVSTALEE